MQTENLKGSDGEDSGVDLSEYIGLLYESRYLITLTTLLIFISGLLFAVLSTPIYRADALMQIEQGKKAGFSGGGDLAMLMGQGGGNLSSSATEMQLLKSRTLIKSLVEHEHLDIKVTPHYLPYIGRYLAHRHSGLAPAAPMFGLVKYAWGGEQLIVTRFDIADKNSGLMLVLVAGNNGNFRVNHADGTLYFNGTVGKVATSVDGDVSLFVAKLVSRAGTEFILNKLSLLSAISSLQGRINISEQGRGTGLLRIVLEGSDRERIADIVQGLAQSYLRKNVEQRSEESENMINFINEQLPVMRVELDAASHELNLYREKSDTFNLSLESTNLIQQIAAIEKEISILSLEQTELSHKLTDKHPVIRGINDKIESLQYKQREFEDELKKVPKKELEYIKLNRNVEVATELYMLLLNKSQELKVTKAGTLGDVRIVDEAVASLYPVKPKKMRIVLLSLVLGLVAGVLLAILRKSLNKTVNDPSIIEKQLGLPVYAEIPFSEYQQELTKVNKKGRDKSHFKILAHEQGDDQVVESLRSLRTSIQFALMEAENNLVMFSGPSPEIGKSFLSANFAYLMAESGKKVLLLDADMRKGHLYQYFRVQKSPGLSELLSGGHDYDSSINKQVLNKNLDLITTGIFPPNPSELLMSGAFKALLEKVKSSYDIVIIDTPPILAVTDASIIGNYAACNFMILRAGQHHLREIETAFKRFDQNGVRINGAIFNGIELMKGRYGNKYGYGYKYYGYQYDYKQNS